MPRIAICISGHLRDFDKCWENLQENFISILQKFGCDIDYYTSFWDVKGNRETGWVGPNNYNTFLEKIQPVSFLVERFDRSFFTELYNTEKWKEYKHLSGPETCGDAVSMWYKIESCYKMIMDYENRYGFTYDVIVRLRSDLLFDTPYDITELTDILNNDVVYMPRWHGKWPEVSRTITDYFGIGNRKVMARYLTVFNNIDELIKRNNCPHTGEGFLAEQIKDLNIKRMTGTGFSVQRVNRIEQIVAPRKRILVFITHATLSENHADMCLKHLCESRNPMVFDTMFVYNSHQDELSNQRIMELCLKNGINSITREVSFLSYDNNSPKTLSADFTNIVSFLRSTYAPTDTVFIVKSDIMVSVNLLNELGSIEGSQFVVTPPFVLAKQRISDEEIFNYTRRECFVRSDDITFFNEDEDGSNDNDHGIKDIYDEKIDFISCTVKSDFSSHYMTLNMVDYVVCANKSWGGLNFNNCRQYWRETRGFVVHKYHGIKSVNHTKDRVGMNYLYS